MKKEIRTRRKNKRPVLLNVWNDPRTLGMFCQKTNLVDYARLCVRAFREPCDNKRLFDSGVRDADDCTFDDIAFEISQIRDSSSLGAEVFDEFISRQAGPRVFNQMMKAIEDAHDWETEEIKKASRKITDTMFISTGRQSEREKTHSFIEAGFHVMEVGA